MEEKMINLTSEEKNIENDIDNLVSVSDEKKAKIEGILRTANKTKSISLRISEYDLNRLKKMANADNLPYQTLINSILHKYITNQLMEKKEILKSIRILNNNY